MQHACTHSIVRVAACCQYSYCFRCHSHFHSLDHSKQPSLPPTPRPNPNPNHPVPDHDCWCIWSCLLCVMQLVQKPASPEPDQAVLLGGDDSSAGAPMAEAPGLTDPRDSDTASAMEGVERHDSHGSHGQGGSSADNTNADYRVCACIARTGVPTALSGASGIARTMLSCAEAYL